MTNFVKVMDNTSIENDTLIEIINVKYLYKVVRWNGDDGTKICFEWYCPTRQKDEQWIYDCDVNWARENMFSEYEKLLTGLYIRGKRG